MGSGGFVICSTDTSVGWEWIPVGRGWVKALAFSGTDLFAGLEGDSAGVYIITHNAPGSHMIIRTLLKDTDVYSLLVNDTGIFAGTAGGVFLSTDNGVNWAPLNNGLTQLEVRALTVKGSDLFAGTWGGGVFRSSNNGSSWTPANAGLTNMVVLSFAVSGEKIFAGTWRNGVFLSTDNGDNWSTVNTGLTDSPSDFFESITSLAVLDSNLYAGTGGAGVWQRPLSEMITSVESFIGESPLTFSLQQNYPNPFNYQLPKTTHINISIYNVKGQLVRTLIDGNQEPGYHAVKWDSRNNYGDLLGTSIYFAKFTTDEFIDVKKVLLIK